MIFRSLTKAKHQMYTGRTLPCHPNGFECTLAKRPEKINGHVIVDFKEANRSNPAWTLELTITDLLDRSMAETMEDYPVKVWKDRRWTEVERSRADLIFDDDYIDEYFRQNHLTHDPFLSSFESRYDEEDIEGKKLQPADVMLLPNRVVAYTLQRRRFALIQVDGLRPVEPNKEGWNDLILPGKHKNMIQAQIKMHFKEKQSTKSGGEDEKTHLDVVRGKGEGLIILLHGVPGVGKTSTAECVAESLGRPLFPITCGDLGTTAEQVENNLDETFALAEAWGCVLLLDEADVFLARRTRSDLKRNAIVSVFLRVLEYYTGILILTTNRVGAFDEAMKSRVKMYPYYPDLHEDQTLQIWERNLERTKRRKAGIEFNREKILKYATNQFRQISPGYCWNGRQIRSMFQTATALAEYEAYATADQNLEGNPCSLPPSHGPLTIRLKLNHFKTVVQATVAFEQYIAEAHGRTQCEQAASLFERADHFDGAPSKDRRTRSGLMPDQYPLLSGGHGQLASTSYGPDRGIPHGYTNRTDAHLTTEQASYSVPLNPVTPNYARQWAQHDTLPVQYTPPASTEIPSSRGQPSERPQLHAQYQHSRRQREPSPPSAHSENGSHSTAYIAPDRADSFTTTTTPTPKSKSSQTAHRSMPTSGAENMVRHHNKAQDSQNKDDDDKGDEDDDD